jgi:predicted enzyme related to lactoylglutathione lyase
MRQKSGAVKEPDAGGEVLGEPMLIPNFGRYVAFLDPEGNRGSILESG